MFTWRFWGILNVLLQKRRRKVRKKPVFFMFFVGKTNFVGKHL